MLTAAEFLNRFAEAVKAASGSRTGLAEDWRGMESRDELLSRLADLGFDRDKLIEIQRRTEHADCDILDVMMDIAYGEVPITREMRAARARAALHGAGERLEFAEAVLKNYVAHGVWTLTKDSLIGLLKLRYTTLGAATKALGFTENAEVLDYYSAIQRDLFAA